MSRVGVDVVHGGVVALVDPPRTQGPTASCVPRRPVFLSFLRALELFILTRIIAQSATSIALLSQLLGSHSTGSGLVLLLDFLLGFFYGVATENGLN